MIPSHYNFVHKTKLHSGALALEQIPPELEQVSARRPLVITDKQTGRRIIKALAGAFARTADPITVFDDTPASVDEDVIREVVDVYNETGCNSILALGGSSVVDTAKGVIIALSQNDGSLASFSGKHALSGPVPPFYVTPTMIQQKASINMSLKVNVNGDLLEFVSTDLMPRAVFVDARSMVPAPAREIAQAGMAAVYRAIEAATGPMRNPVSTAFAAAALKMLSENLAQAINTDSKNIRAIITSAGILSEIAVSNTIRGLGQALTKAVSDKCRAPEDVIGAVLLPGLMKIRRDTAADAMSRVLLALVGPDRFAAVAGDEIVQESIKAVKDIIEKVEKESGLKFTLTELGLTSGMDEIAQAVANDTDTVDGEPVSRGQILQILKTAA